MSEIKSALELALEKTKSIATDKETIEKEKFIKQGKTLVSRFLENPNASFKDVLKHYDKKQKAWVKDGIVQVVMANLVLPQNHVGLKKNKRLEEVLKDIVQDKVFLNKIFEQLVSFFEEYIEEKERIIRLIDEQYARRLAQKEEELSKKLGQPVKIDKSTDPEYASIIRNNIARLDEKYQAVLSKVKSEITKAV
jgi:hypothetical protein